MKKFLFSMALALGAICMPSQASAAEVSSPVVNNIKATTTFQATPSNGPVVIITKDGTVIIVLYSRSLLLINNDCILHE